MADATWELRSYRNWPPAYSGTEIKKFMSREGAEAVADVFRRSDDYFCVEVREIRPAYFWLGAEADHG